MIYKGDWKNLMPKWELKCQQWELHKVRYPTWQVYQNQYFCVSYLWETCRHRMWSTLCSCVHICEFYFDIFFPVPFCFSIVWSLLNCDCQKNNTVSVISGDERVGRTKKNNKWKKKKVLIKQLFIRVESSCYDPQTVSFFFWQVQNSEHILGLGMANFYMTDQDLCGSWAREREEGKTILNYKYNAKARRRRAG